MNRRPVKDLVAPGRFLLIAGERGGAWCEAARRVASEAGVPLDAVLPGAKSFKAGSLGTFQGSWLHAQQAAMEAVRAVETGRPAVLGAMSGTSAAFLSPRTVACEAF